MSEERAKWIDIPKKYRLTANEAIQYNPGVSRCIECGARIGSDSYGGIYTGIGFARYGKDIFQIHECNKCFTKQRYHLRSEDALWVELQLLEFKELATKEKED